MKHLLSLTMTAVLVGSCSPALAGASVRPPARAHARPATRAAVRPPVVLGAGWWGPEWWYDPLWYPPYPYNPPVVRTIPGDLEPLGLDVRPGHTSVKVDGIAVGEAHQFDSDYHPLWLKPGPHKIVLSYPGYRTLSVKVDTSQVANYTLHYRLEKGTGRDERSTTAAKTSTTS